MTADGKTKLKTPSGTLSTAEAISVVNSGLALAAHFGDGTLRAGDVAAGLVGAVVKDPVQDRVVWLEYLETVVKERDGWKDLYRAMQGVPSSDNPSGHASSASATTAPARRAACVGRWKQLRPDAILVEGPPDAAGSAAAGSHEPDMQPPVALLVYVPDEPRAGGLLPVRRVLAGMAGASATA